MKQRQKEGDMNQNYTTTFTVDQTPKEAFDAINNVRGWWSEEIDGSTDKLGAEFTFHQKDFHRSTQKITELVPGKNVVWHGLDGHINYVKGGFGISPAQVQYAQSGGISPESKRQWTLVRSGRSVYAVSQKVSIVRRRASMSQKRSHTHSIFTVLRQQCSVERPHKRAVWSTRETSGANNRL
jgi:hypothetical protein